jgi:hypothetical protein
MGFLDRNEHEETEQLSRIADALEFIGRLLSIYLPQPTQPVTGVDLMAFPTATVNVGDTGTGTATALDASGNTVAGATAAVTSSDPTIISIVDGGSTSGVDTVTWTALADGTAVLTGASTDPTTGVVVNTGANNPLTITVGTAASQVASVSLA